MIQPRLGRDGQQRAPAAEGAKAGFSLNDIRAQSRHGHRPDTLWIAAAFQL